MIQKPEKRSDWRDKEYDKAGVEKDHSKTKGTRL